MPWVKGQSGNPLGRSANETTIRALLNARPLADRHKLVRGAFRFAAEGNVQWADWIMKHAGWGAYAPEANPQALPDGSTIREILIRETRLPDTSTGADTPDIPSQSSAAPPQPQLPAATDEPSDIIDTSATVSDTPE